MKTCEAVDVWPPAESPDVGQSECGAPAQWRVNGFPMCVKHLSEYAHDELVESCEPIAVGIATVCHCVHGWVNTHEPEQAPVRCQRPGCPYKDVGAR